MNKRKIITVIMATCFMVIGLGGCGSTDNSIENTATQNSTITNEQSAEADKAEALTTGEAAQAEDQTVEPKPEIEGSDILVVYFSRTGEQYTVGVIDKGNTSIVAEMISEEAGADLF